jgi:SAM-dependent methyltransferase
MELRYRPVVEALPQSAGKVCEVGSSTGGLARWVAIPVVGVEPDLAALPDGARPPNLRLVDGDATSLPFADDSFPAAVAVDTLEHLQPPRRESAVRELVRITAPGGRVIVNGPAGARAADADRRVLARLTERGLGGGSNARWLREHVENGLPTVEELVRWLTDAGADRVTAIGVFDLRLWYVMHLAGMDVIPRTGPLHPLVWGPFAAVARRYHHGPCYRQLVIADLSRSHSGADARISS